MGATATLISATATFPVSALSGLADAWYDRPVQERSKKLQELLGIVRSSVADVKPELNWLWGFGLRVVAAGGVALVLSFFIARRMLKRMRTRQHLESQLSILAEFAGSILGALSIVELVWWFIGNFQAPCFPGWLRIWWVIRFTVGRRLRERIYDPAYAELLEDHLEAMQGAEGRFERGYIWCSFAVRTAGLFLNCWRAVLGEILLNTFMQIMVEPLRNWWLNRN
jgi:hypothetical protein